MINEPPHVHLTTKSFDMRQSPVEAAHLLVTVMLTAVTGLSPNDVETIKNRIIKDGIKVYITGTVDTEMLGAMRTALLRTEEERDQNRVRADHFEAELRTAQALVEELKAELERKKRMYGFLEQGLPRA